MKAPRLALVATGVAIAIASGATAVIGGRGPAALTTTGAEAATKRVGSTGRQASRPAKQPAPTTLPAPRYEVEPTEVHAAAKQLAAEVASNLTTYRANATPADLVGSLSSPGTKGAHALEEAARLLHHPGSWSRGTIVYAQLGGMRLDRASVMVVVRQEFGTASRTSTIETRTLDIRLVRQGGAWVFDELASAGGTRVARPAVLSPEAAAVVDNPRIELPDSARWDIYRGRVSPILLRLMARMAERKPFGVVVLDSGHPLNVFGTNHRSAHTTGHAVDIYRLGTARVIDDRGPDGNANELVRWLYGQSEVAQIGSPWALDGHGGRSFTDVVHQDHIHLAVGR